MRNVRSGKRTSTGSWQHVGTVAQRIRDNLAYLRFIERATRPVAVNKPIREPEVGSND